MVKTSKILQKLTLLIAFIGMSSFAFGQEIIDYTDPSYRQHGQSDRMPDMPPLLINQQIKVGTSALILKSDGNLVFVQNGVQVWESQTANQGVTRLQTGGCICLFDAQNRTVKTLFNSSAVRQALIVQESGFGVMGQGSGILSTIYGIINTDWGP